MAATSIFSSRIRSFPVSKYVLQSSNRLGFLSPTYFLNTFREGLVSPLEKCYDSLRHSFSNNIRSPSTFILDNLLDSLNANTVAQRTDTVSDVFADGILSIKRTYQPKLLRKKRKHGFLARKHTKDGIAILNRRRHKGRRRLCP
jgi:large subunit ribosomal protein L34